MLNKRNFGVYILGLLTVLIFGSCQTKPRQLVVSLYPYIPLPDNFYFKLQTAYQKLHPDVELVINLNSHYYNGILQDSSDVVELDCVFLRDFIDSNKIQPISDKSLYNKADLLPAGNIAMQDGKLYAIPHWLCTDFLFYKKTDTAIANANTLTELEKIIGPNPHFPNGLLIDFAGGSTLGEYYGNALLEKYKTEAKVKEYTDSKHLDSASIDDLVSVGNITYSNWWSDRESNHGDKSAYFERQFGKGYGRAYIGYSETMNGALDEIANGCSENDICLKPDDIAIKELDFVKNVDAPLGWVDALTLNKKLTGDKLKDAQDFIRYFVSSDCYHLALIPDEGASPRYLLTPYKRNFTDTLISNQAPLYKQLYPIAARIKTMTFANMANNTKTVGGTIDRILIARHTQLAAKGKK